MNNQPEAPLRQIKISRVILPTLLGIGVVIWLLVKNFDVKAFDVVTFTEGKLEYYPNAFDVIEE